ncbi:MAG: hypothetical protein KDA84_29920, partial [Planctomycetaceae bacterium]|nr:hypothetical protein [Planctomycetaceae bacterium]
KSFKVYRLASCYVFLTNRGQQEVVMGQNRFLRESAYQLVDGPVYAIDPQTGKQLWKTQIDDQALESLPPYNSPVLMFNKHRAPGQFNGAFGQNDYLVRIVDLRTGDLLYENNRVEGVSPWRMQIQPTRQLVTIRFSENVIEIELTKEPLKSS